MLPSTVIEVGFSLGTCFEQKILFPTGVNVLRVSVIPQLSASHLKHPLCHVLSPLESASIGYTVLPQSSHLGFPRIVPEPPEASLGAEAGAAAGEEGCLDVEAGEATGLVSSLTGLVSSLTGDCLTGAVTAAGLEGADTVLGAVRSLPS